MTELVVLDASSVLAWRDDEAGAAAVVDPVLDGALLSAVNAGEVRYKAADSGDDPDELILDLVAIGVQIVAFTDGQARHIPELRVLDRSSRPARRGAGMRRPRTLSLADLCCLALAREVAARVVTGDAHWSLLTQHGLGIPVTDYRSARP